MSTRAQVKIEQAEVVAGHDEGESVTLYHHTDGYPSNMIPTMQKLFDINNSLFGGEVNDWHLGRAGKVAGLVCATDPGIFEPEQGHGLHGDIEWYYKLLVSDSDLVVEVYNTYSDKWDWDNPSIDNMNKIYAGKLKDADGEQIEKLTKDDD